MVLKRCRVRHATANRRNSRGIDTWLGLLDMGVRGSNLAFRNQQFLTMKRHLTDAKAKKTQKWIVNFCAKNRCSLSKSELQFFYELCITLEQIEQKNKVKSLVIKDLFRILRNIIRLVIRMMIGK